MSEQPICPDCADNKGWKIKGVCGWWTGECSHCRKVTCLCAERDYRAPGQRHLTLDDLFIYEANNQEKDYEDTK